MKTMIDGCKIYPVSTGERVYYIDEIPSTSERIIVSGYVLGGAAKDDKFYYAVEYGTESCKLIEPKELYYTEEAAKKVLKKEPIEIVHCRDCKYYHPFADENGFCVAYWHNDAGVKLDDYCSQGARK